MNEMKSEIGEVVYNLYYDLQPKKRLQLRRKLGQLINVSSPCEIILNPGIYDSPDPISYEIEIMGWTKEQFDRYYE